ncbi:MAG: hypothetical protein E7258_00125 [Lachnospiraceae bacterium]|nr:hypothetical protein [Lachnospiraceae bacterium]
MAKKIYNFIFIFAFWAILAIPMVFADYSSGGVSEDENRNLAKFPDLVVEGNFNQEFTREFETWFMDHMGYRQEMITANAKLQYYVFGRMLETSEYYLGRHGDVNYATEAMLLDYAHLNLRSEEDVARIGDSYQYVSDWCHEQGIQFYYVQCFDKHSIYPEQFMASVNQIGDVSKTDQIINYLKEETDVKVFSMKDVLLDSKDEYEVYSNWGDPTHWTHRGAFIGYQYIMEGVNAENNNKYPILTEEDYNITVSNQAITLNGFITEEDMLETFVLKDPKATKEDVTVMGYYGADTRHSRWVNESVDNDTKLLLMCDSYFNNYLIEDFAESFSEVWLVWGDYTKELDYVVEMYQPDIIIYEAAERVDRSEGMYKFAQKLQGNIIE